MKEKALPTNYKKGRFGFIFRWDGFEWIRANLDPAFTYRASTKAGNIKIGRKPKPIIDGKKQCRPGYGCGEMLPLDRFTVSSRGYIRSFCKTCDLKRQRNNRRKLRLARAA